MNVRPRQQDSLRRRTDRAIAMGDLVSVSLLRRRLCSSCGLIRTACLDSQRRSCPPEGARVA